MKRKTSLRRLALLRSLLGIFGALCFIAAIAFVGDKSIVGTVLLCAGLAIWIVVFLLWILRWRCPECGKILPKVKSSRMPDHIFCPYCGHQIDLTKKAKGSEDAKLA